MYTRWCSPTKLPNIKYTGQYLKMVESKDDPTQYISFFKPKEYFEYDPKNRSSFIKAVEAMVRKSDDYKKFIAYVKSTIGLNFCQVSSNIIEDADDNLIEMHHGPLFTLYDYAEIILNKYIDRNIPITTFAIANELIDEHFALHVQVVMLSKTNHEAVHNEDIFLNLKQGLGNVNEFIKLYAPYFDNEHKYRIYRYIAMCKDNPSFDNGVLDCDEVEKILPLD